MRAPTVKEVISTVIVANQCAALPGDRRQLAELIHDLYLAINLHYAFFLKMSRGKIDPAWKLDGEESSNAFHRLNDWLTQHQRP
jgi:hypothetical protein